MKFLISFILTILLTMIRNSILTKGGFMEKPKISIFVGHFGSGKTEIAINYALQSSSKGKKTILVDLDIVNPFFRSSEVREHLESHHVQVIAPNFAHTNMDLPSLPASIQSTFYQEGAHVIFDVGGDEEGATVLGRYKQYLDQIGYQMYFVINTRRPFTQKVEDIIHLMESIEKKSRQRITYLVSNTNLSYETTIDVIQEGIPIIEEVSKKTRIPIAYITIPDTLFGSLEERYQKKAFPLKLFMNKWNR